MMRNLLTSLALLGFSAATVAADAVAQTERLCSRYVLISCRPRAEAMNSLGVTPFLNHSSSRCQAT